MEFGLNQCNAILFGQPPGENLRFEWAERILPTVDKDEKVHVYEERKRTGKIQKGHVFARACIGQENVLQ